MCALLCWRKCSRCFFVLLRPKLRDIIRTHRIRNKVENRKLFDVDFNFLNNSCTQHFYGVGTSLSDNLIEGQYRPEYKVHFCNTKGKVSVFYYQRILNAMLSRARKPKRTGYSDIVYRHCDGGVLFCLCKTDVVYRILLMQWSVRLHMLTSLSRKMPRAKVNERYCLFFSSCSLHPMRHVDFDMTRCVLFMH